jgi:hypothetical protein
MITQQSVMRNAFCNMSIKPGQHKTHGSIINAALDSAEHGTGLYKARDWNAHLKLSTYNALKLKGIMQ